MNDALLSLPVEPLCRLIDRKRAELGKPPIDHGAMKSRLTLRFNVEQGRTLDLTAAELQLDEEDLSALEEIVNQQFGLHLRGELRRLCARPQTPSPAAPEEAPAPPPPAEPAGGGLGSRLRRLFGAD
jgi:hypothetical protein